MPESPRDTSPRDAWIEAETRRAQEEIRRANYPNALDILRHALDRFPDSAELREMLEQTAKAALRHDAAVDRNRAVAQTAERIQELLGRRDLETAATELREAALKFGRHNTLLTLQERLEALRKEAELEKTVAWIDLGRANLDRHEWRGALELAERIRRVDPSNTEARELEQRARAELELEAARKQQQQLIEQARRDVERLMAAGELAPATRALRTAAERFGRHEIFDEVGRRLDRAKVELEARKRLEWTERRLNEAEDLVRQAGRLNLQGKYDQTIERLHAARELNPDHPEIADMLQAAENARARARAERRRAEDLQARKLEVRRLLDDLRLDDAEARLRSAMIKFGEDDPQFGALQTRIERLREAEKAGASAAPGTAPVAIGGGDEAEALRRQRDLAQAYSWKQTLLFPFRGQALNAFLILVAGILGLELLASVPRVGLLFYATRVLMPFALLGLGLEVARETLRGKNLLPAWDRLLEPRRFGLDLALTVAVVLVAGLPILVFLATRGWHALLDGAAGWWLAALLVWLAAAAGLLAWGAAGSFGPSQGWRLARHVQALLAGDADFLQAINLAFGLVVAVIVLRAAFLPLVPWMGAPLADALEVYALLGLPHLVGVVVRRHRIELGRIYR